METPYLIPPGLRVYAIGDIHGYLVPLQAMQEQIAADLLRGAAPERVHIVYLGDYVDRGPDSRGVIDYLISRRDRGDGIAKTFIRGNHDVLFLDFMDPPQDRPPLADAQTWLRWGGEETLRSYGVSLPEAFLPAEFERMMPALRQHVPSAHRDFLKGMRSHVIIGGYYFTHAGVDPLVPLERQDRTTLMIMREPFLSWSGLLEKRVVHGHTVTAEPDVHPHRIGLDTGLYKGGKLTCGVFEGAEVRFLQV
ncbi:MAG: metallophosphoesterase [Alphaproteobacteria bacterium]|nr:metallophosphoesterase [Alphaproteobacteria bacterium]